VSWQFSLKHCYTQTVTRRRRRKGSRRSGYTWETEDEKTSGTLAVSNSFDFMIDRENGTDIMPFEDVANPQTFGPGTLIAKVLGQYEDDPDCPLLNPNVYDHSLTHPDS
jgi:hypothetical protein